MCDYNIEDSIRLERENWPRADKFYLEHLCQNPKRFVRVDYDKHPDIQRNDIDLVILNESDELFKISEKKRDRDWEDILIEIYSCYSDKIGWGMDSKANKLAYYLPSSVVILEMQPIVEIMRRNRMTEQIDWIDFRKKNIKVEMDGNTFEVPEIKARNQHKETQEVYHSLSICLNRQQLDKLGIKYQWYTNEEWNNKKVV